VDSGYAEGVQQRSLVTGCDGQASVHSETAKEVTMRKIMLSLCILALTVLPFAHLAAADEMKVKATLTGAAEVPGRGIMMVVVLCRSRSILTKVRCAMR
jgi:CTP synthase (UTP-ammonia lyase)